MPSVAQARKKVRFMSMAISLNLGGIASGEAILGISPPWQCDGQHSLSFFLQCSQGGFWMPSEEPGRAGSEAGSGGGLGSVTPMREFADQKALQDHVKLHDLVYLWEGTRPFAMRFAQLSPEQCEVVDVRTKRGVTRALLFRKALLRAEWKAEAPPREALAMKRQRLRGRPKKRRG
jgi:hypothetical protein